MQKDKDKKDLLGTSDHATKPDVSDEVDVATRESEIVTSQDAYQEYVADEEQKEEFFVENDDKKKSSRENYTGTTPTFITGMIKAAVYITSVVIISVFLAVGIIVVGNDVFALVKDDTVIELTIEEGITLDEMAELLYENGIIKYPAVFKLYASFKNVTDEDFVAGTYSVSPMMNYDILCSAFKPIPKREIVRLTIPEGASVPDIISIFTEHGIGTYDGFVRAINEFDYSEYFDFLPSEDEQIGVEDKRYFKLEGYLYPDTYDFYSDSSETQIIYKLLENFNAKFSNEMENDAAEAGFTMDEIIIIASLIQKEAYYYDDYDKVASVFINRLHNPSAYPKLESDATVAYAHEILNGKRPEDIGAAELEIDSPYNTRKYNGMPPGAICNPGYEAIMCAIYPASTDYYYFVTDHTGYNVFSKTYKEHLKAVEAIMNANKNENR